MVKDTKWFPIFLEGHGDLKAAYNVLPNRTKYTKNEIRVYDDGYCEIDVYDQYHIFKNELIDHKDSNRMNYQRNNLQPITPALNIAKAKRSTVGVSGVHGVMPTSGNRWCAYIEVNKKKRTRNFVDKEDAILQRLIWEINNWKENAPQLDLAKEKYPRLMYAVHNKAVMINDNVELVKEILSQLKEDSCCPCRTVKDQSSKCPCAYFRNQTTEGECDCGLFVKVNSDV